MALPDVDHGVARDHEPVEAHRLRDASSGRRCWRMSHCEGKTLEMPTVEEDFD
jgi:hypothetical protein